MKADMSNLIAEAVANAKEGDCKCQYCGKGFVRESKQALALQPQKLRIVLHR
jgi:hypothetical protein